MVEPEFFGAAHPEVGACLLGLWGLPLELIEAVAYHHTPSRVQHAHTRVLAAVHVADTVIDATAEQLRASARSARCGVRRARRGRTLSEGLEHRSDRRRARRAAHLEPWTEPEPLGMSEADRVPRCCVSMTSHRCSKGLRLQLGRRYEVLTALNGARGPRDSSPREPSIAAIVSDMRMPLMDGAAFLARARAVRPHAGRILLTGQTDLQSAIAAVNEAGILKFLSKPCPPPKLQAAVEAAIHHHRRSRSDTTTLRRALTEEMASEDLVTGLASRKRFIEVLARVLRGTARSNRTPNPTS